VEFSFASAKPPSSAIDGWAWLSAYCSHGGSLLEFFMMYWDFPSVTQGDRLDRSEPIDLSKMKLSPEEAFAKLGRDGSPGGAQLAMFDGRPVYHFTMGGGRSGGGRGGAAGGGRRRGGGAGQAMVYADDGSVQGEYTKDLLLRIAARWTGQPASSAKIEEVTATDQWTVQGALRNLRPIWKYTFPDREQVYVNGTSGEVVQYTTLGVCRNETGNLAR
jgi:hypothetical protein